MFRCGRRVEEVTTFSDSDWAGCKETRKSPSAGVILLGSLVLKGYKCKQQIIARISAEAELCAAALGAFELKGIVSLLKGLGYGMKPVLAIDAKATEHILHRQGIGRLKHIYVAYVWMQDEDRSKWLRVRRVKREENVADWGTTPLSKAVIAKHCLALVDMAEENAKCKLQDAAMFWDCGSIHMIVTGNRTVSAQNTAGDHVKKSSQGTSRSGNGSSSKRTSSRRPSRLAWCEMRWQHKKNDEATQEVFVIYCRKDAQCVKNGWWLSQNDRAGEALAWNARETQGRRLDSGSTKARARESPGSRSSRSTRGQWA